MKRVLGEPCFSVLALFEQICARTPIPQQREALIAVGAPISARTFGRSKPAKGVSRK